MVDAVAPDDVWASVPRDARPQAFRVRCRFLLAGVRPGDVVVDVGCGLGDFSAALAAAGAAPIGVDASPEAVRRARERHPGLDFRVVPAGESLPLSDASADVVWAGEVLEHVVDGAALLSEARRVLRPDGRLLVSTPYHGRVSTIALALAPRGFERHFDPRSDHVRFFTRRSLALLLSDLGFDDVRVRGAGRVPLLRQSLLASARRPPLRASALAGALGAA
jgi:SAM-dependent methyltransferase